MPSRKRPFSSIVENALWELHEFVDDALASHKEWIQVKGCEVEEILDEIGRVKEGRQIALRNAQWDFMVGGVFDVVPSWGGESSGRVLSSLLGRTVRRCGEDEDCSVGRWTQFSCGKSNSC